MLLGRFQKGLTDIMQNLKAREKVLLLMLVTGPIILLIRLYSVFQSGEELTSNIDIFVLLILILLVLFSYVRTKKQKREQNN